jgi:hypothetical protein
LCHYRTPPSGGPSHEAKDHVHRVESRGPDRPGAHRPSVVLEDGSNALLQRQELRSLKGNGFKSNYFEVDSGEEHWISGPRRDGADRLYGESTEVEIDGDVREEYWTEIRCQPHRRDEAMANR